MSKSDVAHAVQMLALEHRSIRRLNATARLTLEALQGHTIDATRSVLGTTMAAAVLDVRTKVREAAARQFTESTGIDVVPSGANDRPAAQRAGQAYAKAWYQGGGGSFGGGGSSDDDAVEAGANKIKRISAYEVAHAWNDEHRRNADALPEYRFVERWCAILDTHLCIRCRRMNGRRPDFQGEFAEGWPPLHGDCRCIVITTLA